METQTATPNMYRNSALTVEEFNQLPIADRENLNRHCDWVEKHPEQVAAALQRAQPEDGGRAELTIEDDSEANEMPDFDALADETAAVVVELEEFPEPVLSEESAVYKTTNYDLFTLVAQNRVVNQQQVRKLIEKIKLKNLLPSRPIDVTADMEVVDGQHRLAAARELGLPIYYSFTSLTTDEIADVNTAAKNWNSEDYLHFWVVQGKPDYRKLNDFMQRHPRVGFGNAKMMLNHSFNTPEDFRLGLWKTCDVGPAETVVAILDRIRAETAFKYTNAALFVKVLHHCVVNVEGFDPQRFLDRVVLYPRSLVICPNQKTYLEMFSEIYNKSLAAKNRVSFF